MSSEQESSLDDVMSPRDPSDGLRNRPELPNQKLEVWLKLTKKLSSELTKSLESDLHNDGMEEVQVAAKLNNVIVVSGFPREGGYEATNVLTTVKTLYDDGAIIITPKQTRLGTGK